MLTKQDIEKAGFRCEFQLGYNGEFTLFIFVYPPSRGENIPAENEVWITFNSSENTIVIDNGGSSNNHKQYFEGCIYNIDELKWILSRIDVEIN